MVLMRPSKQDISELSNMLKAINLNDPSYCWSDQNSQHHRPNATHSHQLFPCKLDILSPRLDDLKGRK